MVLGTLVPELPCFYFGLLSLFGFSKFTWPCCCCFPWSLQLHTLVVGSSMLGYSLTMVDPRFQPFAPPDHTSCEYLERGISGNRKRSQGHSQTHRIKNIQGQTTYYSVIPLASPSGLPFYLSVGEGSFKPYVDKKHFTWTLIFSQTPANSVLSSGARLTCGCHRDS